MQVDLLFDKTSLSPYIRFGCLSVRYFLSELKRLAGKDSSMEALVKDVTGKLLQREFYFTVAKQVNKNDLHSRKKSKPGGILDAIVFNHTNIKTKATKSSEKVFKILIKILDIVFLKIRQIAKLNRVFAKISH